MTPINLCHKPAAGPLSTSRALHFWEVVPLEMLLGQLGSEGQGGPVVTSGNATAHKLHQLLVPSYFPGPQEGVVRAAHAVWHCNWHRHRACHMKGRHLCTHACTSQVC